MLILASASPRRRDLLARVGVAFTVRPADIDETQGPDEAPLTYVRRVAAGKAAAAVASPHDWVLAADTIVALDGQVHGKAETDDQAAAMLRALSGRTHQVTTAVVLRRGDAIEALEVTTDVEMIELTPATIAAYVASGEWRGKAGAYAVQGIAAALVRGVRGSITNVVGLPLVEVLALLERTGAATIDLARGDAA